MTNGTLTRPLPEDDAMASIVSVRSFERNAIACLNSSRQTRRQIHTSLRFNCFLLPSKSGAARGLVEGSVEWY